MTFNRQAVTISQIVCVTRIITKFKVTTKTNGLEHPAHSESFS